MPLLPVALFGLEVPCGDVLVPATPDFPATFRITMAAIDPSEPAEFEDSANGTTQPRATLKLIRHADGSEDGSEDDEEAMRALLAESSSDEDSESDEETNGGPSDPSKSKKARKQAALEQLIESLKGDGSDEDMEDAPNGINGKNVGKKGKAKATGDDESEDESDDDEDLDVEEFVLCTLDPEKNYQQPLDITVAEGEHVYFKVTGSHTIYLTGNYVIPDDDGHNHHHEVYDSDEEEDEDYDLSPDEDELDLEDDESDDLDDLPHPRVTELDSEDEEAPALIKKSDKKGKNKRSADEIEAGSSLDDIMAKSLKAVAAEEPKLSKKQLKKLKKNNGESAPAKTEESKSKDSASAKSDKKVQFAKNLEQGPTGSADKSKSEATGAAKDKESKATLGTKNVGGVTTDDKKLGKGPACKKGNRVSMRYIGKLADGKVFDSNKSGKPFSFKLGAGEVIQGWDVGVAGMSVGGERRLIIPAKLAYGSRGQPGIPANSTLTFDVKLLEIK